jgi:hypothetical protein
MRHSQPEGSLLYLYHGNGNDPDDPNLLQAVAVRAGKLRMLIRDTGVVGRVDGGGLYEENTALLRQNVSSSYDGKQNLPLGTDADLTAARNTIAEVAFEFYAALGDEQLRGRTS